MGCRTQNNYNGVWGREFAREEASGDVYTLKIKNSYRWHLCIHGLLRDVISNSVTDNAGDWVAGKWWTGSNLEGGGRRLIEAFSRSFLGRAEEKHEEIE
jgi:hypothetical protein